jgi:hypothetical protein
MQNTLNFLDRDDRIELCKNYNIKHCNNVKEFNDINYGTVGSDIYLSLSICSVANFYSLEPHIDFYRAVLES